MSNDKCKMNNETALLHLSVHGHSSPEASDGVMPGAGRLGAPFREDSFDEDGVIVNRN
jgi:hypothetical protein